MAYQYGKLGQGSGTAAPLNEGTLPPLLVVWLYFVVNPTLLDTATAADYQTIGNALNLTPQCVSDVFTWVKNNAYERTQAAAAAFQSLTLGPGNYSGGGSSCGDATTIQSLATQAAVTAWTALSPKK